MVNDITERRKTYSSSCARLGAGIVVPNRSKPMVLQNPGKAQGLQTQGMRRLDWRRSDDGGETGDWKQVHILPCCSRREQVYCLEKLNQRGTGQLGTTVMEEDTSEMLFKKQDNQVKAYKINGEMSNLLPWPAPKRQQ